MPPVSSAVLMVPNLGTAVDAQVQTDLRPFFTAEPARAGAGHGPCHRARGGRLRAERARPGQHLPGPPRWPPGPAREALPLDGRTNPSSWTTTAWHGRRLGLQKLGYRVTTNHPAEEALALFQRHPDAYDLVFLDLSMPGLNGLDLAQKIQACDRVVAQGMEANDLVGEFPPIR